MTKLRWLAIVALCGGMAQVALGLPSLPPGTEKGNLTTEVQVIGVYEGNCPPGAQRGGGNHPPGEVTVKVAGIQKQVILVLTAYEPVIWKVQAPKDAVVRVIASGYHKQTVEGLDKSVPVTLISHDAGDKDYFYAHQKEKKNYEKLVARVKELTKSDVKNFQGKYTGETFEVR